LATNEPSNSSLVSSDQWAARSHQPIRLRDAGNSGWYGDHVDQQEGLERFRTEVEGRLPGLVEELVACAPHRRGVDQAPTAPGIYLYSEDDQQMYVGRTRDLSRRWADHTRPSSGINSASFAFNIAKKAAAAHGEDVAIARSRLAVEPVFARAFVEAKARVREMDYRFVRVDSPVLSTVGEVYAAMVLGTEGDFNEFETH
jgi:hypothetical protein